MHFFCHSNGRIFQWKCNDKKDLCVGTRSALDVYCTTPYLHAFVAHFIWLLYGMHHGKLLHGLIHGIKYIELRKKTMIKHKKKNGQIIKWTHTNTRELHYPYVAFLCSIIFHLSTMHWVSKSRWTCKHTHSHTKHTKYIGWNGIELVKTEMNQTEFTWSVLWKHHT